MLAIFAPGFLPRTRELVLPHLAPFLGASLKAGLVLAVKASVTAEYFGANNGIGFQIQAAYMSLRIRSLFAWAMVLILVILVFNHLLPRLRLAGPFVKRLFVRKAPVICRLEDVQELKHIFTSLAGAPRISLHGVSFSYRGARATLKNVSLEVSSREIAVVTGDSGNGKTTLLNCIAGRLQPSGGAGRYRGRGGVVDLYETPEPYRRVLMRTDMGIVHQNPRDGLRMRVSAGGSPASTPPPTNG